MSSNSTTAEEDLHPLVIPLSPPRLGSAIERFLSDMLLKGMIDASIPTTTSNKVSKGNTAGERDVLPTAVYASLSDSGDTTAYSSDTSFSEGTTYSSDSVYEVTDKLGGITIAAGVNEGSSFTRGRGIDITASQPSAVVMQRYLVQMWFEQQAVSDNIGAVKERYTAAPGHQPQLNGVDFMVELDNGSNTTWVLGAKCRELTFEPPSTVGDPDFSVDAWQTGTQNNRSQPLGEREVIYDHACIHCKGKAPVPDGVTAGVVRYADKSGAAVLLHHHEVVISFTCFNWAEKSWTGSMSMNYKPAVAYAVTDAFRDRPQSSGLLALGPLRHQAAFGSAIGYIEAPSFLEALRVHIPCARGLGSGMVMYFALRPPALYRETKTGYKLLEHNAEHWLAFNGWPCKLQPRWSEDIHILTKKSKTSSWKVRLLSMTFQRYNVEKHVYESIEDPENSGIIKFGDSGLVVHLDCGSSATMVPPSLVRHIRTKLWPTAKNLEIDEKYQDNPCSLINPEVPFYIPARANIAILYHFADRSGRSIEVQAPGSHFFGQPNPHAHSDTKDKEGLIFVGPPDVIKGGAIFGMNFFQTVFVTLCKPERNDPFVRLAPQWESQRVQFSPRPPAE